MNIEQYGIYILYTLIYLIFAVILRSVLNYKSAGNYSADEEMDNGNLAVGLRRTGAQFGLAIAMMGVLSSDVSSSLISDLLNTALYGFLAVIFIVSSLLVTDRLVIPGVNNLDELKVNNISVGVVELAMLIATGIIAYSSLLGETGGILSSISYFIAGQLTLVALVLIYEKGISKKFNIVDSIKNNNISSGLYLAGKLIAYALILKSAISGNTLVSSISGMAIEYLSLALAGFIILYLFEIIIDKFIVTSSKVANILAEDKIVPAIQLAVSKVGIALILSNAIL